MNKEQKQISKDYETTIIIIRKLLYNQMIKDIAKVEEN